VPIHPVERKLAAIFAADVAGYSRLMASDEVGTLARLKSCRAIVDGLIASHPSALAARAVWAGRFWLRCRHGADMNLAKQRRVTITH
jgi:hypothetical protein